MQTTITQSSMTYEEYKTKMLQLLKNKSCLPLTEIEKKLGFSQTLQHKQWLQTLKNETGLQSRKDNEETILCLPKKGVFYTIGYEGKTIEQFIDKLELLNIKQVIDVREIALSRKKGFTKNTLRQKLEEKSIIYKHFPELGSPTQIRDKLYENWNYTEFFKEYVCYLENKDQQKALAELEELACGECTAIMCFERDVSKCHRKIIGEKLGTNGFGVVNL